MQQLSELLKGMAEVAHTDDVAVSGLCDDSRDLIAGYVFLAYPGTHSDGRDYIYAALEAGASAVIYEAKGFGMAAYESTVPLVAVSDLRASLSRIAARFYGHPSRSLNIYAVTGTNGKTSVAHFLAQSLSHHRSAGVMGTLGNGLWGSLANTSLTTPSALHVQELLGRMAGDGVRDVVMEASSHGLSQDRLAAVHIDTAIFTNLSQDHLDYHKTMADYAAAKRRLFEVAGLRHAVVNVYDEFGAELAGSLPANVSLMSYGLDTDARYSSTPPMVKGVLKRSDASGIEMLIDSPYGSAKLASSLFGRFNAENLLAVLAALLVNNFSLDEAISKLSAMRPIAGRMESFSLPHGPQVFVDFAHTPAALDLALSELNQCCEGRVYLVFGCGGDRDQTKRALMGRIAQSLSSFTVLTDDNPRSEAPEKIIADILSGFEERKNVLIEHDRAKAIIFCLDHAQEGDIVLIAGKGHENYQLIGDQRLPFSDRELVRDYVRQAA